MKKAKKKEKYLERPRDTLLDMKLVIHVRSAEVSMSDGLILNLNGNVQKKVDGIGGEKT